MKAYVIVQETIKDQTMFDAYRKDVLATVTEFGGQFIVRGGNLTVVEGEWPHQRTVIIEFPSRVAAEVGTIHRPIRSSFHCVSRVQPAISSS
jgi:uncharacterized protein (DUF1330 family)